MEIGFVKLLRNTELSAVLHGLVPVVWFLTSLPAFVVTIQQRPGRQRWFLLPFNVAGPIICFLQVGRLKAGLDWLWAFTSIIYIFHATSGLYLEQWTIPDTASRSGDFSAERLYASVKAWNNPRRLPLRVSTPQRLFTRRQRAYFTFRKLGLICIHWGIYLATDVGTLFLLRPAPGEFAPPGYFHFALDRAALLRTAYSFQWAWLTYFILTVANAIVAIFFVSILQLDEPDEWPSLWGNPLQVHSIRSFWGVFWQNIGSPSQLTYGRFVTRNLLGLKSKVTAEKSFLAFFIFMMSGTIHAATNWMTRNTAPVDDIYGDMVFLLLNFAGGLLEVLVQKLVYTRLKMNKGKENAGSAYSVVRRAFGVFWVFVFFYTIVPPWQFPYIEADFRRRFVPFRMNVQLQRPQLP
ncbi:hypothetical protein CGLO_04334 [Colletotrichum gloeosporioides Cg-14]|uniref:Wax synthase domain-containing protein n=1 Tax=Colletotrichum gloeosporioides (strain Cg-14) TaxID=1237896 RepID=T0KUE5_COLGC|nr:hypothetical protein CGLO_04334 [Colletotrichum gloeosporioides Cg-14]